MAEIATISLIAGIASAAVGAGTSIYGAIEQKNAQKDQKKARQLEIQKQETRERQRRRQEIRQRNIAAARVANFAAQTGAGASSGPVGGLTSLNSQLGVSQGFASEVSGLNRGISALNQSAQDHLNNANTASAFGGLALQGLSFLGSFDYGGGSPSSGSSKNPTANLNVGGSRNSFLGYV